MEKVGVQHIEAAHVQMLDPLDCDRAVRTLPALNAVADLGGLVTAAGSAVPNTREVADFSFPECLAAMRDLGIFAGSIKRHGAEPVEHVPGLEAALLNLSGRTGMIPRDTIHHYAVWNPLGLRERLYTGEQMEILLKSSVRRSLPKITAAIELCGSLHEVDPADIEFTFKVNELVTSLRSMEDAIESVVATVTPEFFARSLRPYFEEFRVAGRSYLGPAAAHVPLALIDLCLWASDNGDAAYTEFWEDSAEHALPQLRPLYDRWPRKPSVVTRVADALRARPDVPNVRASAEAVSRALRSLVNFRGKHYTIAKKAYAEEVGLYTTGSGGGTIALLDRIMTLTRDNSLLMRDSRRRADSARRQAGAKQCES
ncbi:MULTISPECIES: monodechloroaminopyrrolnitrin synthase PrnB family protein [Amycolatopsis]|uniref:Monodechloroaminopyrrolnitrin synthase PrnB family protein n=1 Tax=Amycolatopsis albidoflavus TaxID=102226 RepID=A0ABW5HS09_9PSEU